MEKYRLVQEQKLDEVISSSPPPTTTTTASQHTSDAATTSTSISSEFPEVRITQQGKPRNYISYAMGLLVRYIYIALLYLYCCFVFGVAILYVEF
jgi:hypothetical protein